MKLKFETVFRTYQILLATLLMWSLWASAQTSSPANTTPAPPVATSAASTTPNRLSIDEQWMTFGLDRIEPLKTTLFTRPIWQYLAFLIFIGLAFYFSKCLDWLINNRLKKWAAKTETKFDDLVLELLHGPVKVITFVILLHVGLRIFSWPDWVEVYLTKCMYVIVACSLTYMALKFVDLLIGYWQTRVANEEDRIFDAQFFPIISKSMKVFVVIVSVLVTTQNLGLNITGALASLSIGGLAIGLAAQDTLANLFGAVAVFVDRPFRIGDRIKLDAVDGTVESIGMRSTRVRNADGHLITIPNKTMGNATITNISRRPNIKTEMNLGLTYGLSTEKVTRAMQLLEEIYRAHAMTQDVWITFNKFADSSLNVLVIHWWKGTDYKEYLLGMRELNLTIKHRFDNEDIEFAFPSQTIHVKQDSDWKLQHEPPPPKPT